MLTSGKTVGKVEVESRGGGSCPTDRQQIERMYSARTAGHKRSRPISERFWDVAFTVKFY